MKNLSYKLELFLGIGLLLTTTFFALDSRATVMSSSKSQKYVNQSLIRDLKRDAFQNPTQNSAPTQQNQIPDKGSFVFLLSTFQFIVLALLCYYILVARPAQVAEEDKKKLVEELKKGDEVLISGTIFGKVFSKSEKEIIVEVTQGMKLRVVPERLSRVINIKTDVKTEV